ncbi:MAG: hypothetical protein MI700_00855, partial [Balneolales bacterium]|nr:hypothetical protein [Balneolales bacterium]
VPTNINLKGGSNQLNYLNQYLVQRIGIALSKYPQIAVRISIPADDRFPLLQQQILEELAKEDSDVNRYMFMRGVQGDQNVIRVDYFNADHLVMMEQQDDIKFVNNNRVPELLENMLRVLKSREDYELIHDLSQSYVVPDRVNFMRRDAMLDNESQAVMSRIGSYLRNNPEVYLELSGDGTQRDRERMYNMVDYLEDWGVDVNRILISKITVVTDGTAIRVEYKNADSINLLNIESLNLRPGVRGN